MSGSTGTADSLALSVHGPSGVLDLIVPVGASAVDLAREYREQSGLAGVPQLYTRLGQVLLPDVTLADAGVTSGTLLVALLADAPPPGSPSRRRRVDRAATAPPSSGTLSALWFCLAVATAALAGWVAARLEPSSLRTTAIGLLIGAAVVGALPIGRWAAHRVLAAPAFAAAAAFAIVWDPEPTRLPTILGISALAAGVVAAVARALAPSSEEALRVWMIVGALFFVATGAGALSGVESQVVWALMLIVAMLAARFVPGFAVDVPDQYLIDLERLAVTAWSARDRPTGRRGRIVVPRQAVAAVASSGTRMVTAACASIVLVVTLSAPLLLATATLPLDRVGARFLVGFAGAALLLAARSYRHAGARALLRAAGLVCWASLAVTIFDLLGTRGGTWMIAGAAIGVAALLVVVSVALGRGWRSAWWSRRAEIAEGVCGAFAVGSVVVAVGLFRYLWELTG